MHHFSFFLDFELTFYQFYSHILFYYYLIYFYILVVQIFFMNNLKFNQLYLRDFHFKDPI